MALPKIFKILNIGLIAGIVVALASFLIPIVPCTKSPIITKPVYEWGLCKLPNPFKELLLGLSQKYFNLSTEPLAGFLLQMLIIIIIAAAIFSIYRKKIDRGVIDLTKKHR